MTRSTGWAFQACRSAAGVAIVGASLALSGCWHWDGDTGSASGGADPVVPLYVLSATINGLNSSGLVLNVNGTAKSMAAGATAQPLTGELPSGTPYSVTVQAQPAGLTCSVSNSMGTMGDATGPYITITCSGNTYTVGGSISGLTGSGLVLLDNGGDATSLSANATQFTMNTGVTYGNSYAITVQTVPPDLVCAVSNATAIMGAANVTSVNVGCVPNFTLLYSFAGGSSDGAGPYHSLIQASDGDFYGTTLTGGTGNGGTVFRITPSGTESILYSFTSSPYSGLIQGSDGNFYGTSANGGVNGRGTLFAITPSGTQSVLYSFPAGGSDPYTGLIQASDGNFYGTTGAGGASDDGTVFKVTPGGTATVLHAFPKVGSSDGQTPYAGLIQGGDGNFYGTTYFGGSNGFGTVFKVTPGGTETVLYSFAGGSDGENPYAGVIQGSDGNFYGTTYQGGRNGLGTIFKMTPSGLETVLYAFTGGSADGANPEAGVIQGSDGYFYGATYLGGASNLGTVFQLTSSGAETILHAFSGNDGANPWANLVQGSDGSFYGSTTAGGASGHGTFFKVAVQ